MKNSVWILGFVSILFLSACSSNEKEQYINPEVKAAYQAAIDICEKVDQCDDFIKPEVDMCKLNVRTWSRDDDLCVKEGVAYYNCMEKWYCGKSSMNCMKDSMKLQECLAKNSKNRVEKKLSISSECFVDAKHGGSIEHPVCKYFCKGDGVACENDVLITCENNRVTSEQKCSKGCKNSACVK